ncbi:MAG: HDOD domain-containing protein [Gammaproteobacteria bacterium]|nr:HDOD domain-containing protein [Gammaproteobacteria bacterium]MBU1414025.1 HDOD domain-containing protein [Gammaproteobacteria bacterium]
MNTLENVVTEIEREEVSFPTHADVAFRVRLALDDPDIPLGKAAQVIVAEPLLAARVVAVANSVAFNRSGIPVADVRGAVARLGLKFVRGLATAVVMRQMAGSIKSPVYQGLAVRLWEHTVHVAALSHLLAARFGLAPDVAMFAGIVHEVSGFYLISKSDTRNDLFADGSLLTLDAERRVGGAVLAALAVPAEVVAAIKALWEEGPLRYPPETLGDLLRLANQLTPIRSPLQPVVEGMELALDPDGEAQLAEILDQSSEELEALTSALRY